MKLKIIADNKIPFLTGIFEKIAQIEYLPTNEITNEKIKDADALIIRTRTNCNEELLRNTKVQFIATATIGFDHIDTDYCKKVGIYWKNAVGCNAQSVAQYMYSVLLNLAFKRNFKLAGKTLGIIGVGNVGKKVEMIAKSLNMNTLLNDPLREKNKKNNQFTSLEAIKNDADFITFHTPLTKEGEFKTFHLADKIFFSQLKKKPFIINTSRGEVVDNNALKLAILEKKIQGAVLDVWENEPNIDAELLDLLNFGTPHIAGYSTDSKANCTHQTILNILNFFNIEQKDFFKIEIPNPEKTSFTINTKYKNIEEIKLEMINISYNICIDDLKLRKSIQDFEFQRNNYTLRRHCSFYNYILENYKQKIENPHVFFGLPK